MTLADELKILDDKIKANQAQWDLDTKAATISSLSSKELDKYEYLTSKDLTLKLGPTEIKRADYSPFAHIFTKMVKMMIKTTRLLNTTMI